MKNPKQAKSANKTTKQLSTRLSSALMQSKLKLDKVSREISEISDRAEAWLTAILRKAIDSERAYPPIK
jgi:hypothetical protein